MKATHLVASSNSVTAPAPSREDRRNSRLEARYLLWDLSVPNSRVRNCGRAPQSKSDVVTVKASGSVADGTRTAGLGNVQSCGSVWACPVCAAKIQAKRHSQVAAALAVARLRGWEVLFLTLTMRHKRHHKLSALWDHLSTAWAAVTTGSGQRAWKADKSDFGIQGYVRLVEVTHGDESGWHVHAHVLLFLDPNQADLLQEDLLSEGRPAGPAAGGFTDSHVNELGTRMFLRWRGALDVGGIRPSLRRGVDIKRVKEDSRIAEYFAKQLYNRKGETSTAHDVTGSVNKDAKNGNRTPFGILRSLVDVKTGEVGGNFERDLDLWHTFERASKGRRQLLWARGFKKLLGLDEPEQTDQEIVDEAPEGETIAEIPTELYAAIARRRLLGDLLSAAELDDTGEQLRAWLGAGLDWYLPDRPL